MGLKNTIETSGYGFFVPDKVCWGAWKFYSHLTNKILFGVWQLQNSYSKSYQKVANASTFDGHCHELFGWLGKQFSTDPHDRRTYKALQMIWKWVVENLVWEFQKEVLAVCQSDMKADVIPEDRWIPTNVYFSVHRLDPIMKKNFHLVQAISHGQDKLQTPLERLQHLWEFDDGMRRQSWDKKSYRLMYRKILLLWNMHMELYGWKWCHIEFTKFFIRRCPVWPNATTGKWFSIKQSSRVWHALQGDTSINLPNEW